MKRYFLLIYILTFLCSGKLFAQNNTFENEFYIGVGGGVNSSRIDFVPGIPQDFKFSYLGGVAAKYITQNHLGLLFEANFSQRGWKEEFDPETEPEFSYNRTLNYLEIPFMTHIYFGNKTKFIFNIGPQLSFLISDKQDMSDALAEDLEQRKVPDPDAPIGVQYGPEDELKRFDYGLVGGIGIQFQTGIGMFDLEGRYYFGLGDVFESRRSKNAYFQRSAHRIIEAKLTYYLRLR